jgi:hypothetical protein
MTKRDILDLMESWSEDAEVDACLADGVEHLDELEPGSLLQIVDGGFTSRRYVLYVEPR